MTTVLPVTGSWRSTGFASVPVRAALASEHSHCHQGVTAQQYQQRTATGVSG
jgi:hypothetical protein